MAHSPLPFKGQLALYYPKEIPTIEAPSHRKIPTASKISRGGRLFPVISQIPHNVLASGDLVEGMTHFLIGPDRTLPSLKILPHNSTISIIASKHSVASSSSCCDGQLSSNYLSTIYLNDIFMW